MTDRPVIVLADDDPTIRLARFALEGPGAVTEAWLRAYFSPEEADPERVRDPARRTGLADRCTVVAGRTGTAGELGGLVKEAAIVIFRRAEIDGTVLAAAPKLRLIQRLGERPEGIDLAAAAAAGVEVSCVPRRSLAYTAEHAVLLMLAVAKRLIEADAAVRAADYDRGRVEPINDVAYNWAGLGGLGGLYGKTLGIVGLGEVGTLVARGARAFGMRVLYTKRRRLDPEREAELQVAHRSLPELLAEADYVSVHAPQTPETESLFDAQAFARMKPGAVFVNTARGSLVDEEALYHALKQGHLRGAGLDNHRVEPRAAEDPFCRLPNVVLTPHIAGGSRLGLLDEIAVLLQNCRAALDGAAIRHAVLPPTTEP